MDNGLSEITGALDGTGSWLFQHSQFKSWIGKPSGLLWISGKQGSGKSVLTRYILQQWQNYTSTRLSRKESYTLFFSFDGAKRRISMTAMLKSLLYQALIRTPLLVTKTLAEIYANKTESLGTPGIKWEWDQEELKRHFQEIMWKTASWSQTVVVFVDALDECEEFNSVVSYFQTDLLPKSIHVLVSSRLEPSISGANKVRLDENNQADIQTYIRSQLLDSRFSSETIWISQIIDEADGCFLWVKLVLAHSDFSAFGTNEIIWLPHNLEEAYRLIMSRTMAGDSHLRQKYARKILRLITYTLRPVTIEELWDGLALGHSKLSSVYGDLEEAKLLPHSSNSISNAASMVEYVSGGLLEVVDLDLFF